MPSVKPNPEGLTGKVQGKNASDIEERFARAIAKIPEWQFSFRLRINPLTGRLTEEIKNIKGEVEIDFLLTRGELSIIPVMIQGEYSHFKTPWQDDIDKDKEKVVNEYFERFPQARPVVRIPDYKKGMFLLDTQEFADQTARSLLL